MHRPRPSTGILTLVLLAATVLPAAENSLAGQGGAPLPVPRVETALKVDGLLDEDLWQEALLIPVNVEVRPGENIEPPVQTDVLLAYGPKHLYVGFRAFDPDPDRIRARYSDRDHIFADDWVAIILDTFNDARRSFNFTCNPLGVQGDAIETQNGGDNAWDAIWDSAGRIGPEGYTVEMSIPFSSLRFQRGAEEQIW